MLKGNLNAGIKQIAFDNFPKKTFSVQIFNESLKPNNSLCIFFLHISQTKNVIYIKNYSGQHYYVISLEQLNDLH